jgi:hypothetical protein
VETPSTSRTREARYVTTRANTMALEGLTLMVEGFRSR